MADEPQNEKKGEAEGGEGASAGADQSLSEPGESSSESTSSDVHEPAEVGPAKPEASLTDENGGSEPTKEEPKPTPKSVSANLKKIIEQIEKLSVLELSDLVHALEDRFGVSATAPMAVAGVAPGQKAGEEPAEEKTTFNLILTSTGANKISVIKAVRELIPTLGLKEAKDLVEAAPKVVLEGVGREAAEEAKNKLTAMGATVELQ